MKKEPKDRGEVSIIAAAFERSITSRDREAEMRQREAEQESEELSKNPLEVAEFMALYIILIISPLLVLFVNYTNGVNPEADDVRNKIFTLSLAFSAFGVLMALVVPVGSRNTLKDLLRVRGGISDVSRKYLLRMKHQEYNIFMLAILLLMFTAINSFLLGYMPGHYDICTLITMPLTIGIILLLRKFFGCYMHPLYRIIDALPLNLQLFYIFLLVALIALPYYVTGIPSEGVERFGGIAMNAVSELFFISLFVSCIGVSIELVLFFGIKYGLKGTLASIAALSLTYLISASAVSFAGFGMAGYGTLYPPFYMGAGMISFFLGFYRRDKRIYEWYASVICLVSSIALLTSTAIQNASVLAMVAALVILTVYDAKKSGRLSLQPT